MRKGQTGSKGLTVSGPGPGGGGDAAVPADEELPGAPAAAEPDGVRDADAADGAGPRVVAAADGDALHEAVRMKHMTRMTTYDSS